METANANIVTTLEEESGINQHEVHSDDVAHLFIHHNTVVGAHLLPGVEVTTEEMADGVKVRMNIVDGTVIQKPVQFCFGMLPDTGVQKIDMNVRVGKNAQIKVIAHCTFPNAVKVQHLMDAVIEVDEGGRYSYFERHVHGTTGGIEVVPKSKITLRKNARFITEFELLKGRVGVIDMEYETVCEEGAMLEMDARINGTGDDLIKIKEIGHLKGAYSKGALKSRVALRDNAKAEIYSELTADGDHARGHVDCKEIIQDNGIAKAIPIVEVRNPKAHITHEAAIGSVDSKQLATLMARGLDEDEAVELIIQGLLR